MNRLTTLTACFLLVPALAAQGAEDGRRPNVLFISVDDLNDWVGFLDGHPQALTPNMDRLAKRGVVFTNAHCASPACNPSRAAVFSGRMPSQTGVWSNKNKKLFQQHPDIHVLPHSFRGAGYATYGTGKLMHSSEKANQLIFDHHFNVEQRWSPFTRKQASYTKEELPTKGSDQPKHLVKWDGPKITLPLNRMPSDRNPNKLDGESFDWGPIDVPDPAMGDTQITDWAINQLKTSVKADKNKPFFLGVGYYRPHIPLFAPAKYFERFDGQTIQLPKILDNDLDDLSDQAKQWAIEAVTAGSHNTVVKHGQWEQAVKSYLACVTFVDEQIGRLIDTLDTEAFGDNTIVVLWSDHGWHLGEKQHWGTWTGWERSTRVPLVIVPPKRTASQFARSGSRCDTPVSLIDLFPTLADLCDLKTPDELDGQSLVPLLREPDRKSDRIAMTVFNPGNISLRSRRWRMIRYADGSTELYDLKNDPNEWSNLAYETSHQAQLKDLELAIPSKATAVR